ncbi:hypothetical protein GCM10009849_03480 [Sinomonas flava]|uniref:Uncharacterized protein n=1 Tax=Sinomonas flava TaxID=496857 RepID=A0ABP5NB09_9MICC
MTVRDPAAQLIRAGTSVEPVEFRHRQLESGWEKHVQCAVRRHRRRRICRNPGAAAVKEKEVAMDFMQWLLTARIPLMGSAFHAREVGLRPRSGVGPMTWHSREVAA